MPCSSPDINPLPMPRPLSNKLLIYVGLFSLQYKEHNVNIPIVYQDSIKRTYIAERIRQAIVKHNFFFNRGLLERFVRLCI